jgi:hypothetical protein
VDDEAISGASSRPVSTKSPQELPEWLREDNVAVAETGQANLAVATGPMPPRPGLGSEMASLAAVEAADLPDWLRFPSDELPAGAPRASIYTTEEDSSLSPWLADLGLSNAPGGGDSAAVDLPMWLRDEPSIEDNSGNTTSQSLPDWLRQTDELAQIRPVEAAKAQPPSASLPAWLRDDQLDATDSGADPVQSWLRETNTERAAAPSGQDTAPSQTEDTHNLPAWLQEETTASPDENSTPPTAISQPAAQAGARDTIALPSWLLPTTEEREVETTSSARALPDWLSLPDEPPPSDPPDQAAPGAEHIARIYPNGGHVARIYPEARHAARVYTAPDTEAATRTASNGHADTLPSWLVEGEPAAPGATRVLPPWLDEPEQAPTQAPPITAAPATTVQTSGASDLPAWLHDPDAVAAPATIVEAAPATPRDQQGATVMAPEALPAVVIPAKPVIQRSAERVASMELLERLVLEPPREPMVSPVVQRRARAVMLVQIIAFVLLLAAILVALLGPRLPLGERVPSPNAARLATRIAALVPGAPVLVAYEWDARRAAEMEPLENAVVSRLMARRAPLLLLTTDPQGALLSRRRAALLREQQDNFYDKAGLGFVDLGYKPGGAFALARMSSSFGSVFEQDWTGASLLGQANVIQTMCQSQAANIADCNLDRIGMVIVLADESEDARAWIEQVESRHPTLPLTFVTPTEVAPLVQPYLTGPNVTLAAGLGDAVGLQTFGAQADAGLIRRADANVVGGAAFGILVLLGAIPAIWNGRRARQAGRTGAWER